MNDQKPRGSMKASYQKEQPQTVQSLFNDIAPRYELANSLLSFHTHALWNNQLASLTLKTKPQSIIDLCSGTGDIAKRIVVKAKKNNNLPLSIALVDFSEAMLEIAKKKPEFATTAHTTLSFHQADVTSLPFSENQFDVATCAYGARNVKNLDLFLQEAYRVLKPHGALHILELTRPHNQLLATCHSLYLKACVPLLGKLLTSNREAYRYLEESIHTFVSPHVIIEKARKQGFKHSEMMPLSFGIATLITLKK